jgi:septal ring factor EnvC (AmiA/AmiB activator)
MGDNIARVDGVAYVRAQCEKCGKWGSMAMPQDNAWDRLIAQLQSGLKDEEERNEELEADLGAYRRKVAALQADLKDALSERDEAVAALDKEVKP